MRDRGKFVDCKIGCHLLYDGVRGGQGWVDRPAPRRRSSDVYKEGVLPTALHLRERGDHREARAL